MRVAAFISLDVLQNECEKLYFALRSELAAIRLGYRCPWSTRVSWRSRRHGREGQEIEALDGQCERSYGNWIGRNCRSTWFTETKYLQSQQQSILTKTCFHCSDNGGKDRRLEITLKIESKLHILGLMIDIKCCPINSKSISFSTSFQSPYPEPLTDWAFTA